MNALIYGTVLAPAPLCRNWFFSFLCIAPLCSSVEAAARPQSPSPEPRLNARGRGRILGWTGSPLTSPEAPQRLFCAHVWSAYLL